MAGPIATLQREKRDVDITVGVPLEQCIGVVLLDCHILKHMEGVGLINKGPQ